MGEPERLLDPAHDPPPVEIVPASGRPDILLVCEHAGRAVPASLGDLGISKDDMDRHIAYDVGAEEVARGLAARTGAALILQRYSRLVIDCNRPPLGMQSVPDISDGTQIPANHGLSVAALTARVDEIFTPFARAIRDHVVHHSLTAAFSIHSFTPVFQEQARPWHLGLCARREPTLDAMVQGFRRRAPSLNSAANQPYQIDDETDWFIPRVAEPAGVRHALIEIRNDQIAEAAGVAVWVERLAPTLMETP
jgi:predicted N-formylglutamate amidohydrolase